MSIVLPYFDTGIAGWTMPNELRFLHDEAVRLEDEGVAGGLLEVGCWLGRSTAALAQAGPVDVVDLFRGSPEINSVVDLPRSQYELFMENMEVWGLAERVHVYEGWSTEWLQRLVGPYRLVFVDGGHDYETVSSDLTQATRLLSPGGTLVVDDLIPQFPGVQRAVREVLHNDLEQSVGKMGVWRAR